MLNDVHKALAAHGLAVLGGFTPGPDDGLPEPAPGRPARAVALVINAGSAFWPHFTASAEYADGKRDPLNRWSARVIADIAGDRGAGVLFPFDGPPWWPFPQWGLRTGAVSRSPLGVLAHRDYGLWFAFRGALLLPEPVAWPEHAGGGPCETCRDKPCLDACPADALTRETPYAPDTCRAHVAGEGAGTCGSAGCLVRHACPFGTAFAYTPEQARYHMSHFAPIAD